MWKFCGLPRDARLEPGVEPTQFSPKLGVRSRVGACLSWEW